MLLTKISETLIIAGMTPHKFYKTSSKERIEQVCKDAGTTLGNFQQIALANGSVSARLAKRLEEASGGEMTLSEILFPSDYDQPESA